MKWIVLVLLMLCSPALGAQEDPRVAQAADLVSTFVDCGSNFAYRAGLTKERAVFSAIEGKLKRRCLPYLERARALMLRTGSALARGTSAAAVYRGIRSAFVAALERGIGKQKDILASIDRSDIHGLPMHRLTMCSLDFANEYAGSKLDRRSLLVAISRYCRAHENAFRRTFAAGTPEDRFQTAFLTVYAGPVNEIVLSGIDR